MAYLHTDLFSSVQNCTIFLLVCYIFRNIKTKKKMTPFLFIRDILPFQQKKNKTDKFIKILRFRYFYLITPN